MVATILDSTVVEETHFLTSIFIYSTAYLASIVECLQGTPTSYTELMLFLLVLPNLIKWQPNPCHCPGQNEKVEAP